MVDQKPEAIVRVRVSLGCGGGREKGFENGEAVFGVGVDLGCG